MATDADLMGIGQHCSYSDCQQLDFLPFKCTGCQLMFCLDHRRPEHHNCKTPTNASAGDVLVCPNCAAGVKLTPNEDPNITYERHSRIECDPSNYNRVHKKTKCPVPHCREKLTTINQFTCKDCQVTVCLKHRLAMDHQCAGPPALLTSSRTEAAVAAAERVRQTFKSIFSSTNNNNNGKSSRGRQQTSTNTTAPKNKKNTTTIPNRAKQPTTNTSIINDQLTAYRNRHGRNNDNNISASASLPEACPQCSSRFGTVQELIDHASSAHTNGWSSGALTPSQQGRRGGGGGRETDICPHCGAGFLDPVALVNHVEKAHASILSNAKECILS